MVKNALHYVNLNNNSEIYIYIKHGSPFDKVYFKDTGKGISADNLPHIFERFFSKTIGGVGLAFCKQTLQEIGGDILCSSVENEFTKFELRFPNF